MYMHLANKIFPLFFDNLYDDNFYQLKSKLRIDFYKLSIQSVWVELSLWLRIDFSEKRASFLTKQVEGCR